MAENTPPEKRRLPLSFKNLDPRTKKEDYVRPNMIQKRKC